ncbi:hypothetical protein [Modestobacter sp. SYSU DS0290]
MVMLSGAGGIAATVWGMWVTGSLLVATMALISVALLRASTPPTSSTAWGLSVAVTLCGAIPVFFLLAGPGADSHFWQGPLLLVVLAGVRISWLLGSGKQRLYEFSLWMFVYVFLALAPMVQALVGEDPVTTPDVDHELDFTVFVAVAIGAVSIYLGVRAGALADTGKRFRPKEPDRVRALLLMVGGLTVAWLNIVAVGIVSFFSGRQTHTLNVANTWGDPTLSVLIRAGSTMPLLVGVLAWRLWAAQRSSAGGSSLRWLAAFSLVTLFIVVNPVSSARYEFGTVALALLASLGAVSTRQRFRVVSLGLLLVLIFGFAFADLFRFDSVEFKAAGPAEALLTGDYDAYAQLNNAISYTREQGYSFGFQALGPLLFWIPRSLWAGKPIDTGEMIAEYRGYGFTNLSAPLWAELFVNGGWVLLIVGLFVLGYFVRRLDDRTVATLGASVAPPLSAVILAYYSLLLLRGSLLQASAMLVVILMCVRFAQPRSGARVHTWPVGPTPPSRGLV